MCMLLRRVDIPARWVLQYQSKVRKMARIRGGTWESVEGWKCSEYLSVPFLHLSGYGDLIGRELEVTKYQESISSHFPLELKIPELRRQRRFWRDLPGCESFEASYLIPLRARVIWIHESYHILVPQGYETIRVECGELVLIKSNKREEWAEERQGRGWIFCWLHM